MALMPFKAGKRGLFGKIMSGELSN